MLDWIIGGAIIGIILGILEQIFDFRTPFIPGK